MKKYIVSFLLLTNLLTAAQVFAATFENSLSTCSRYVSDDGKEINMVLGWINRKCYYMTATSKYKIDCGLSKNEHAAMVKAMNEAKKTSSGLYYFDDFFMKYVKNLQEKDKENLNGDGSEKQAAGCSIVTYGDNQN